MDKLRLPISQLTPGMKLAEPITNANGVTMMPAGIRLTPMFILRLKKWGVEVVEVFAEAKRSQAGEPVQNRQASAPNVAAGQEEFARALAVEVSRWFVNVKENPLMMDLRAVAIKRLVAHGRDGMINTMRRSSNNEAG